MRILIVDNNIDRDCWGAADLVRYAAQAEGAAVYVRRAPQEDLPADARGYDRWVISGSRTSALEDAPWITRLEELIRRVVDAGKPLLGVCYGHQVMARALGGKAFVNRGREPEFGWTRIEQLERSPLLEGLPREFYTFSSHYDEVVRLPSGMRRLARSESCGIQACQLENRPVFGIQFHPEKSLEEVEKTYQAEKRRGKVPKNFLHPGQGARYYDPKVGETIFRNFFSL